MRVATISPSTAKETLAIPLGSSALTTAMKIGAVGDPRMRRATRGGSLSMGADGAGLPGRVGTAASARVRARMGRMAKRRAGWTMLAGFMMVPPCGGLLQ